MARAGPLSSRRVIMLVTPLSAISVPEIPSTRNAVIDSCVGPWAWPSLMTLTGKVAAVAFAATATEAGTLTRGPLLCRATITALVLAWLSVTVPIDAGLGEDSEK